APINRMAAGANRRLRNMCFSPGLTVGCILSPGVSIHNSGKLPPTNGKGGTSLSRQLENPQRGAAIGRVLDVRDQRPPSGRNRAAVADRDGDVLLAVDRVADGRGIRD